MFYLNKTDNPTIGELEQNEEFELIGELSHSHVKSFVKENITDESSLIKYFMIYQVIMILAGLFFMSRSLILAFKGNTEPIIYVITAIAFCFSLLIIIHELLHALALKITGAKHISFGGSPKKFIFYAEADKHVLNRKQFAFIALTPLIIIKILSLIILIQYINQPLLYFFITTMSIHSLFCAGDIVMLSVFYRFPGSEIFTYDIKEKRKSYFYKTNINLQGHKKD